MAVFEIDDRKITPLGKITFESAGLRERDDIQRLLKENIDVVCSDVLVISESFRDWEDSKREIDLLGIDKNANLVVIELKRTGDGGHAELQAIRYAAMISVMTFEKATEVFARFRNIEKETAEDDLLSFLEWEEPDEDSFAQDVRIILVSAGFSKEITTSVMWLNQHNLDISCVVMQPYIHDSKILVDVKQVIPLPEAQDYIIRLRDKANARKDRKNHERERFEFWKALLKRSAGKTDLFSNVSPSRDGWIGAGCGISGLHYLFAIRQHLSSVIFALEGNKDDNKARFNWLAQHKNRIESVMGEELKWERCGDLKKSIITLDIEGGYCSGREQWPEIQDKMINAMVKLEEAIKPLIPELKKVSADHSQVNGNTDDQPAT